MSLTAILLTTTCLTAGFDAQARDASFLDPGATTNVGSSASGTSITVEPRGEIDLGDGQIGIARRSTVFFVNQTTLPVDISSATLTNDGGVKSEIVNDECSKEGRIEPTSRCTMTVEMTPTVPGPWRTEILLAHKGAGRVARARLTGKATGQVETQRKDSGLSLSVKDVKPLEFGTVEIDKDADPVVRSAVMINDSNDPISLMAIDVIAADNGLDRLKQGCAVDMELRSGESCPVTLVWKPTRKGIVSTDLIIRHTGKMGFTVIPVRGIAKQEEEKVQKDKAEPKGSTGYAGSKPPSLPTAKEIEMMSIGSIPPISGDLLPPGVGGSGDESTKKSTAPAEPRLIGTVGNRGVFLLYNGQTKVAGQGDELPVSEKESAKITNIMPRDAEIFINGKKKLIQLKAAQELIEKASAKNAERQKDSQKPSLLGGSSSSSTKGGKQ